jgi:hypothetical protein
MMQIGIFKKLALTVMGVGVIGSLMSAGTFATFTASTTNAGNTFTAGTLFLTDTKSGASNLSGAPNTNGTTDPSTGSTNCAANNKVASDCGYVLKDTAVSAEGLEPGQYMQGTVTLTNNGTLPAAIALQIQNAASAAGTCAQDLTCADVGTALRVTIEEDHSGTPACLFGGTGGNATQAPSTVTSAFKAVASACDDLTNATYLGSPTTAASTSTKSAFKAGAGTYLTGLNGAAATTAGGMTNLIWIPGSGSTVSLTAAGPFGNISSTGLNIAQWAPGESHTFLVTVALPDSGYTTAAASTATVIKSNDDVYQNGTASFDLVFVATQ